MTTYATPTDSDAGLISALKVARETFDALPTVENERAWARAHNAVYDYQRSMALGTTVVRLDLRTDGTVKKFGE